MRKMIVLMLCWLCGAALAVSDAELLKPEQAFHASAKRDGEQILLHYQIAEGYYLYRSKFKFSTNSPGIKLGDALTPEGEIKHDPFFGDIQIYRGAQDIRIPISFDGNKPALLELEARSQGCADAGICYPPRTDKLLVTLIADSDQPPPVPEQAAIQAAESLQDPQGSGSTEPKSNNNPLKTLGALSDSLGLGDDDILPVEQAFQFDAKVIAPDRLKLTWLVADETYMYQEKIRLSLEGDGVSLGDYQLPPAKIKHDGVTPDGETGEVAVYVGEVTLELPLVRGKSAAQHIQLVASYQGCADRGICYPPQKKRLELDLPALDGQPAPAAQPQAQQPPTAKPLEKPLSVQATDELSEQDQIASLLSQGNWLVILASFFGIGLLLAFTPCVFPMIPILSGIIAGHGHRLTTSHAFLLSLTYVLAMSVTYTVAGVLAGLFGANLQAAFQNPWILSLFAGLFVALALSMFGFFDLQLPSSWQAKLAEASNKQQGGQLWGVAIMGFLSALIVGPCVAPPLAGALIFIGQTGDAVLGGAALFAMSLGMGAPLIAIGTSAGKLLPKAGPWMDIVKAVFGVAMLGLAISMLERILPASLTMLLWGLLMIVSGIYMGALHSLGHDSSGWHKLWKGLGIALIIYGSLFLLGAAAGGKDTLQPLRGLAPATNGAASQHLNFQRVKSAEDLHRALAAAKASGKPVMLDFYADWCVYCKQMEKDTFPAPEVQAALAGFVLLQADVTAQDEADLGLQAEIGIPAPPAMIFWNARGSEQRNLRLMGFLSPQDFAKHVGKLQ